MTRYPPIYYYSEVNLRLPYLPLILFPCFAQWPQAAGPNGNWQTTGKPAVTEWSVARNQNILWKTNLPNAGQSGIAVGKDKLFVTTFTEGEKGFSAKISGHAIDRKTGAILWSVNLEGVTKSPMAYSYSDSTSPSPITDGKYVWFTNSSGEMGCWTVEGKEVWRHKWTPWGEPYPFNKQHEPILYGNWILNVEPLDGNPASKQGWNYLRALDKLTGKTVRIAEDGTTTYTTSMFGMTADGKPAVMTGRGGWHDVPERPVGLSLMSLAKEDAGKSLWRFVAGDGNEAAPTWQTLYILHWNPSEAYWFRMNPEESHLVIDSKTGKLLREQSLIRNVDYRQWDPEGKKYVTHTNVNLREVRDLSPRNKMAADEVIRVMPAWHANIVVGGYHYFMASTAHRRNRVAPKGKAGPSHCLARINVKTGKVEYLEVPVTVIRKPGQPDEKVYGVAVKTQTINSKGVDVATEERSRMDGWETPAFWGTPTAVNGKIFFNTQLGITYVVDANAKVFDERALLAINDLGPSGETWSLSSVAYGDGILYHRSLKELVAIGKQ